MVKLTAGETLDEDGNPIPGTGFEYDSDGPVGELIANRRGPIFSQPDLGEFVFLLIGRDETNGEFERVGVVFPPGNLGPPEHFHPNYDEVFEVVAGEFIFRVNGKDIPAVVGDVVTAKKNEVHSWRCAGDVAGVAIADYKPPIRGLEVLYTMYGMSHEGKLNKKGEIKNPLQAIAVGREFLDDVEAVVPLTPSWLVRFLLVSFYPLVKLMGYKGTQARYMEESFWAERVKQPPK